MAKEKYSRIADSVPFDQHIINELQDTIPPKSCWSCFCFFASRSPIEVVVERLAGLISVLARTDMRSRSVSSARLTSTSYQIQSEGLAAVDTLLEQKLNVLLLAVHTWSSDSSRSKELADLTVKTTELLGLALETTQALSPEDQVTVNTYLASGEGQDSVARLLTAHTSPASKTSPRTSSTSIAITSSTDNQNSTPNDAYGASYR